MEQELTSIGPLLKRVAGAGVVALLEGSRQGKTSTFKADMDALPLIEKAGSPYCLKVDGAMHAGGQLLRPDACQKITICCILHII